MNERQEGHMQQHMCACMIDIANEKLTIVYLDETQAVAWPEIKVLQHIHGEDAVYDIRPVALAPRDTLLREKERMALKYGRDVTEEVYAGKAFMMEWFMPGWPIDPTKATKKKTPDRPRLPTFRPAPDDEGATDARI